VSVAARVAIVLLPSLAAAACASKPTGGGGTAILERTPLRVDSTAAGAGRDAPAEPVSSEPKGCAHAWLPDGEATHTYLDVASDPPLVALCTPLRCTKCGASRHECLRRRPR
jgi:hypothetical protein